MSNRATDLLFQLIHSLEKAEKRNFKLYIKRSSSNENLKVIQLFDALDKMREYDEKVLLKRLKSIEKAQLSNLKSHLYKQILASLRILKSADSIDLQLNEQFDYAHILYKKGLYLQSLRILEKAKDVARAHQKFSFMTLAISLEKRIESLHITRSMQDRAEELAQEAIEISNHIDMTARMSNLAIRMYSWFIRHGHAMNEEEGKDVKEFFFNNLPPNAWKLTGFYERLYLYQSYSWYAFIRQDFLMYYRYTQKWVDIFDEQPLMKRVETGHFIKGLHNLLNAHFDLHNLEGSQRTLARIEEFAKTDRVREHDNFRIQSWLYSTQGRINQYFMTGNFKEGLLMVPEIEEGLETHALYIDQHRKLVLTYKIASLYFGSGDYDRCIDYLQRIINENVDLRYDLQTYARLMHLLSHYELGNTDLMDYLTRSVYRFMAKMKNLTGVEEAMFRFLRKSFSISRKEMKQELENFLEHIKQYEKNRFETRSFAYLDIISWVESKVVNKPMSEVIQEKHAEIKKRMYKARQSKPEMISQ